MNGLTIASSDATDLMNLLNLCTKDRYIVLNSLLLVAGDEINDKPTKTEVAQLFRKPGPKAFQKVIKMRGLHVKGE